ncbi:MAG: biotin synthase BioB [Leptospiraceae bacterium]|nr:biotin synthase BioB [Leptospiraceae bacterium]
MVKLQEKIQSQAESAISKEEALNILEGKTGLLETLYKANIEREKYFSKKVRIHILDNIKNGHCPEDCGYCAQRKNANSGVQTYSLKPEEEIFEDAKRAKENGAYRFCIVTAGTGPNEILIDKLSSTINKITRDLGMRVCLSAGLLDEGKAEKLKQAGLDRYNHNLNTSESHYGEICTTHTFQDRLNTLEFVKNSEIGICSGLIVGMGETLSDLVDVAFTLKRLGVISIPVNFFIPVAGHAIKNPGMLTPELCLRILSVFRLVNPDSEIRIGAGREGHLKSLQAMGLFAANSLFASGYLNVKGSEVNQTIEMIRDAGFEPELDGGILPEDLGATPHLYAKENIENLYKYKK